MSNAVQLVGSKTSPYTRRLRMLLHDHAPFEFKAINYLEVPADAEFLKQATPINKLPILIDGSNTIYESRIIAGYLISKFAWTKLTIEDENILSMNDAANDVGVNLFLLRKGGMDITQSSWYIDRQKERLPAIFTELEKWAKARDEKNPAHWNYVAMSVYSYVDWAEYRQMADFSNHPGLLDFVKRFANLPGVAETSPRA